MPSCGSRSGKGSWLSSRRAVRGARRPIAGARGARAGSRRRGRSRGLSELLFREPFERVATAAIEAEEVVDEVVKELVTGRRRAGDRERGREAEELARSFGPRPAEGPSSVA